MEKTGIENNPADIEAPSPLLYLVEWRSEAASHQGSSVMALHPLSKNHMVVRVIQSQFQRRDIRCWLHRNAKLFDEESNKAVTLAVCLVPPTNQCSMLLSYGMSGELLALFLCRSCGTIRAGINQFTSAGASYRNEA